MFPGHGNLVSFENMPKNSTKYYWWCQAAGWGFVAVMMIFITYTLDQKISDPFLGRLVIVLTTGLISTHFLRWVIRRSNLVIASG